MLVTGLTAAPMLIVDDQEANVRALVAEVITVLEPTAREKHVEVADSVLARLRGDALRLKRVMMNLLSSVVKFTERGAVRVLATMRK
jgi:signal transduction histidine kinase